MFCCVTIMIDGSVIYMEVIRWLEKKMKKNEKKF
jgi:hypothetical protein